MIVHIIVCFKNCSLHTVHQPLSRFNAPTSASDDTPHPPLCLREWKVVLKQSMYSALEWHHSFVQRPAPTCATEWSLFSLAAGMIPGGVCNVHAGDWSMSTSFCIQRVFPQLPLFGGKDKTTQGKMCSPRCTGKSFITFPNKKWHLICYI